MLWNREQYIDLMTFGQAERPMLTELFGLLIGLEDEWKTQGASAEELSLEAFDFDTVRTVYCGGDTGLRGGFEPRILEQTKDYVIQLDEYGRKSKLCTGFATIPLPLEYPVTSMDSWRKIKHWFAFDESRIDWGQVENARRAKDRGELVIADIPGGFDLPRQLMGEEGACVCYYDDPGLMQDIMDTIADTAFRVLDRVSDAVVIDNLFVHEDMAGKSGPLIGPNLILKYLKPYYRKVWDMLQSKGTRIFCQDSDGNMNPALGAFVECGINVILPAEPAAGMDIVALRRQFGNRLAFKGGIDKHVLRQGKAAIRKELEYKLQDGMKNGTVFALDHRITGSTTIENYRYYVETAREMLGIPPKSEQNEWFHMCF